jgi:hypothetical protein
MINLGFQSVPDLLQRLDLFFGRAPLDLFAQSLRLGVLLFFLEAPSLPPPQKRVRCFTDERGARETCIMVNEPEVLPCGRLTQKKSSSAGGSLLQRGEEALVLGEALGLGLVQLHHLAARKCEASRGAAWPSRKGVVPGSRRRLRKPPEAGPVRRALRLPWGWWVAVTHAFSGRGGRGPHFRRSSPGCGPEIPAQPAKRA